MKKIITLTVNPALDKRTTVKGIVPNNKLRCAAPFFDAGGGGINVSRAIKKLGGNTLCIHLSGGHTGNILHSILYNEKVEQLRISMRDWTRENFSVTDTQNHQQYRFTMPGATVEKFEWEYVLENLKNTLGEGDFLVASGSLPLGIPVDFYNMVAFICNEKKAKLILDTSGDPLIKAAESKVFMLKPNLSELSMLCGVASVSVLELEDLAKTFLDKNTCEVLVVSLGAKGAVLVTKGLTVHVPAPTVHQKSTIGAGDSMVGGMVLCLAQGKSLEEMVGYGVACGSAATMNPGTELCKKEDADRLYNWIKLHQQILI